MRIVPGFDSDNSIICQVCLLNSLHDIILQILANMGPFLSTVSTKYIFLGWTDNIALVLCVIFYHSVLTFYRIPEDVPEGELVISHLLPWRLVEDCKIWNKSVNKVNNYQLEMDIPKHMKIVKDVEG